MTAGGYFDTNVGKAKAPSRSTGKKSGDDIAQRQCLGRDKYDAKDMLGSSLEIGGIVPAGSNSESTIYKNAVEPMKRGINVQDVQKALNQVGHLTRNEVETEVMQSQKFMNKRDSSLSEDDGINTSDEVARDHINAFLNDVRNQTENDLVNKVVTFSGVVEGEQPQPSTSTAPTRAIKSAVIKVTDRTGPKNIEVEENTAAQQALEDNVGRLIREAETSRARILDLQGNNGFNQQSNWADFPGVLNTQPGPNGETVLYGPNQFMQTAIMDEDYLIVAAHVDETIECRIRNGEFVDFSRLLPRDRVQMQQDNHLEIINQNGHLSCAPVSSGNSSSDFSINSFARWEQAFRVFSNIYTRQFPHRASELIQYNHVIHTASMTYSWSNVYAYEIDFRLHMARHPQRSWSVILQQAWNLRLKDRHEYDCRGSSHHTPKCREICFRYNAGKCTFGSHCKFDHRCGICGKHGHGAHNCRKISDKYDWGSSGNHSDCDR